MMRPDDQAGRADASTHDIRRALTARPAAAGVPAWAQPPAPAPAAPGNGTVRRTVTFSEQAWRTVSRPGKTPAERIGDGLALMRMFDEIQRAGGRVLLERPGRLFGRRLQEVTLT